MKIIDDSVLAILRDKKIVFIIAVIVLVVAASNLYYRFRQKYVEPYTRFREMQFQALPQFDNLNEEVYQELPEHPDTFKFFEKSSYGIESPWQIGRWMTISFVGSEQDQKDFFEYYGTKLLKDNWVLLKEASGAQMQEASYYKGTSCVRLSVSTTVPGKYFISVWQDFERQPFVSDIPSNEVLTHYLYDSWVIAKCP